MDLILVSAAATFLVLAIIWIKRLISSRSSSLLPPNPKGLPILGNLLDLASDEVHVKARDWSQQFGLCLSSILFPQSHPYISGDDVISLNVLGNTMIILNSAKAVSEIFDKRGSNYSDRPDMPMIVDLYAIPVLCFYEASNFCAEWAGTGHSRSCVMVPVGRNTAACFIVISIIASLNIKKYNWKYQESSSYCY